MMEGMKGRILSKQSQTLLPGHAETHAVVQLRALTGS